MYLYQSPQPIRFIAHRACADKIRALSRKLGIDPIYLDYCGETVGEIWRAQEEFRQTFKPERLRETHPELPVIGGLSGSFLHWRWNLPRFAAVDYRGADGEKL